MPVMRSVQCWMAAGALALALTATGAAGAKVFQASANFSASSPSSSLLADVLLPQYSGPGTIESVLLSISGMAGGGNFYEYLLDTGITVNQPESLDVELLTNAYSTHSILVADTTVNTRLVGSIAPCSDPSCVGVPSSVTFLTEPANFSASGHASDLSDFAGTGFIDITAFEGTGLDQSSLSGTVTETIFTGVPEPSAWLMMLLGFGLLGAALRRFRAARAGRGVEWARQLRHRLFRPSADVA